MTDQAGSKPLRARLERYAQLLASPERRSAIEAWCLSDPNPVKPEATPGRGVTASRNANRQDVKDRVAFLQAERAAVLADIAIDADSVSELMERVTSRFLAIGELAETLGLSELAAKLRRATVVHTGRAERLHRFLPEAETKHDLDLDAVLARLRLCKCAT
ncbi:hypothetical protein [Tropicimonas sp. S265A]|uniref:hypothetical protein n=1 Tax=Tropicimonas sp. S265A TaxID=3415134 RepID=UPI003C7AB518